MAHEDGVRRHLAEKFFPASVGAAGFQVRHWDRGRVAVEHVHGARNEHKPWWWRKQVTERRLSDYAAHLEHKGYKVTVDLAGRRVIVADRLEGCHTPQNVI